MGPLNFNHLHYFWMLVRRGSLSRASSELSLSPSTVSAQVHALEQQLDAQLVRRVGRRLEPTDMGRVVFRYAEDIFSLGRELIDTVQGRPADAAIRLEVGVADVVPKLIARRLLQPALQLEQPTHIVCREGKPQQLLADLALHNLDLVLVDAPLGPETNIRAFNHLLGECDVWIFGGEAIVDQYRADFPHSLDGAPFLLPLPTTATRRAVDSWFERHKIRPRIVGEFEDGGLMKVFGQTGNGLFPAPAAVLEAVERQYQVKAVGCVDGVRDQFYAISVERRLKHPAVVAILDAARRELAADVPYQPPP